MRNVIIVGGGISGLAAAWELQQMGVPFTLFEASDRLGGIVRTDYVGEFVIDAGPDAMLVQKSAGIELCRELGIADRLVPAKPPRTAFVVRHGRLVPLPPRAILGIPTDLPSLWTSSLLSFRTKLAMTLERLARPDTATGDESIASFFARRFGPDAVSSLAEPLLAGIHAGDVDHLSVHALYPRLVDAARLGSVTAGLRRKRTHLTDPGGLFRSFPRGMQELVDALTASLGRDRLRTGARVTSLARRSAGYEVGLASGDSIQGRAVILALPATPAASLLASRDAVLAELCQGVPYTSSAVVVLAFPRPLVKHPLEGSGFVVPRTERDFRILAATWLSSKWPGRAPAGTALLRAFLGGARDPDAWKLDDETLVRVTLGDLARLLQIDGAPSLARVYRWRRASAQYEVGYLDRLGAIRRRLANDPGLFVTGAGFGSIGIPDCIADARATARRAAARS
jgi:protoporphyrinogen/coproporphyrinogen III oxidase